MEIIYITKDKANTTIHEKKWIDGLFSRNGWVVDHNQIRAKIALGNYISYINKRKWDNGIDIDDLSHYAQSVYKARYFKED